MPFHRLRLFAAPARRAASVLAAATLAAALGVGCDLSTGDEAIRVTSDRFVYDVRTVRLDAGKAVALSSGTTLALAGHLPGGFGASDIGEAYVEGVRVEQIAPSGAVYDLGQVRDLTLSLNGQTVATNATPSGTTAMLTASTENLRAVFASGTVAARLSFTPTRALGEDLALRVTFVTRVVVRGL